ncbi:MAG: PAS domain-containing protein [Rhodobacteraceae bacterium]|nr:MAG: PAS domain-containing protein [Paracoccaceae bacterium]
MGPIGEEASVRRRCVADFAEFSRSTLTHPDAAGLLHLWQELRGDRPAPFRAELDAGKIGAKAPFLAILEHVGPSNLRVRIAGDRLNKWFGLELRGMSALSLVAPEARNHVQAALNRVIDDPAVAALHGAARAADGAQARYELALLPMRSDFGRVDRVLVGLWLLDHTGPFGPMRLGVDAVTVATVPLEGRPRLVAETASPAFAEAEGDGAAAPPRPADPPTRRGHLRVVK